MTDWSDALRFAYEQRVISRARRDGFGGFSGFAKATPNGINGLRESEGETTVCPDVVSVVSPRGAETSETMSGSGAVSPHAVQCPNIVQSLSETETTETTETTVAEPDAQPCQTSLIQRWMSVIAAADAENPVDGFGRDRWRQMLHDGQRFLNRWGVTAAQLGWTEEDIFGVHPRAPAARYDCMGLVPLIGGGEVIDMLVDRATIGMPSGNCLVYYLRRPNPDAVVIWDLAPRPPR